MIIAIRVDASLNVGTGHTYRMMTLAHELELRNHEVIFFCRKLKGNLIDKIKENFLVVELVSPTENIMRQSNYLDWLEVEYDEEISEVKSKLASLGRRVDRLIVDSYAIDYKWHLEIKDSVGSIIQIDDLDNRRYECDVIIDQNFYLYTDRYKLNTSPKTQIFCGPEYAMLRSDFLNQRNALQSYQSRMSNSEVVIFFGGVDANNETGKLIEKIVQENLNDKFNIIIGEKNPHKRELLKRFDHIDNNLCFHIAIDNVEEIFGRSYIFVGAVGSTTWERCVLGLPGIVVAVAENQIESAEALNELGCHFYLGPSEDVNALEYLELLKKLKNKKYLLELQSHKCSELTDGQGTRRVAAIIEGDLCG